MLSLPQTAVYALRAVYCIAEQPGGDPVRVDTIAQRLKVPRNYLSKTLHQLTRAGVLRSVRGPRGGFALVKATSRLTLSEIITPFLPQEGKLCVMGRGACNDRAPCAAHHRWKVVAAEMRTFFNRTTVADLVTTGISSIDPTPARTAKH